MSTFKPVNSQGECYPGVLFNQDNQPQYTRQDSGRFLPEKKEEINQSKVITILSLDNNVQVRE